MSSCTIIEATVPSGFERVALEEISEKIPGISDSSHTRGHLRFQLPKEQSNTELIRLLRTLRSVDNLYVVIGTKEVDFPSMPDIKTGLTPVIEGLVSLEWQHGIEFWREFTEYKEDHLRNIDGNRLLNFMGEAMQSLDELMATSSKEANNITDESGEQSSKQSSKQKEKGQFSFRVTSARAGDGHPFTSRDVAREVGGLLHVGFGWEVNLTDYDMEVFIIVRFNSVSYCLALTHQSRHRRNADVQRLGNMSLRSTIAYNMLRMCGVQVGDIIVDPMCGSGAIIVESMLSEFGQAAFHIAGDSSSSIVLSKAQPSIESASQFCQTIKGGDCLAMSVAQLPFRTASIDVIIADMPFGRRCGHKSINKWLYPAALNEFARVLVPSTGRACLLTGDVRNLNSSIGQRPQSFKEEPNQEENTQTSEDGKRYAPSFWTKPYRSFTINHGGLNPMVYLLKRSALKFV